MARRKAKTLKDNIDGSQAHETLIFAMDGISYEIDLSKANATELRNAFRRYIKAARRTGTTQGKLHTPRKHGAETTAQVRAWAQQQGLPVMDHGSISLIVLEKYAAAH